MPLRRVCVYCGARSGARRVFLDAAEAFADVLVARGIGLVYGGASIGLMGAIADRVLAGGGEVIGVLPSALFVAEVAHRNLTQLIEVTSMHERKAEMARLADAFVAMPGGFGTLDELFEALTWTQIGIHDKPCGLLDVDGYFEHLLRFLERAVQDGFLAQRNLEHLVAHADPNELIDTLTRSVTGPGLAVEQSRAGRDSGGTKPSSR
ncbi:MAG: TIGR00730 family Rossman fold protein [Planctomycetota bacterium]